MADRLAKVLREMGAELVIHGHIHTGRVHKTKGPQSPIPVVCTPSASAAPGRARWPASYNLFHIDGEPGKWQHQADRARIFQRQRAAG